VASIARMTGGTIEVDMADKRPESRIVVERSKDGKTAKIKMVDPRTGRESIATEVRGDNREVEKRIEQVKQINERAGNHATVKEV
jgi:hypothetical protein